MIVRLTIFIVALACSSNSLTAQETPSPAPGPVAIPTGITDPAAATRAWLDTIPPDEKARSDAYFEGDLLADSLEFSAYCCDCLVPPEHQAFRPNSGSGRRPNEI